MITGIEHYQKIVQAVFDEMRVKGSSREVLCVDSLDSLVKMNMREVFSDSCPPPRAVAICDDSDLYNPAVIVGGKDIKNIPLRELVVRGIRYSGAIKMPSTIHEADSHFGLEKYSIISADPSFERQHFTANAESFLPDFLKAAVYCQQMFSSQRFQDDLATLQSVLGRFASIYSDEVRANLERGGAR